MRGGGGGSQVEFAEILIEGQQYAAFHPRLRHDVDIAGRGTSLLHGQDVPTEAAEVSDGGEREVLVRQRLHSAALGTAFVSLTKSRA